jgi:hypothetical protein
VAGTAVTVKRFVALAACVPVLALAACGSTSEKARYDARVSRLCLVAADQFRELHLDNSVGDWKRYGPTIVHIEEQFDNALAALPPPSSIAKPAAAFLDAYEKLAQDAKKAVAAANAGDRKSLRAAIAAGDEDDLATLPLAKTIGATGCYIAKAKKS